MHTTISLPNGIPARPPIRWTHLAPVALALGIAAFLPGRAPPSTLALDVDGDGRPDRVVLARHGDGWWLDVYGRDGALASTTRIADGDPAPRLRARDLDGDGRDDLVTDDGVRWLSNGASFDRYGAGASGRSSGAGRSVGRSSSARFQPASSADAS